MECDILAFRPIEKQFDGVVDVGKPLPEAYSRVLQMLESSLTGEFWGRMESLRSLVSHNTMFNKWLAQVKIRKHAPGKVFRRDPLFWNLAELTDRGFDGFHKTPSYHIARIDEALSQASYKDKACIDQDLYDEMGNVAALDECLSIVESHRSRERIDCSDDGIKPENFSGRWQLKLDSLTETHGLNHQTLWNDVKKLMDLPVPSFSKPQRKSLDEHIPLHEALVEYWRAVQRLIEVDFTKEYEPKFGVVGAKTMAKDATAMLQATSTHEYVGSVTEQRQRLLCKIEERGKIAPIPTGSQLIV